MTMTQDTFNKLVTLFLLIYCSCLYTLSWYTNKPLDLESFLVLLAPLLTHMGHILTTTQVTNAKIKANNGHTDDTSVPTP